MYRSTTSRLCNKTVLIINNINIWAAIRGSHVQPEIPSKPWFSRFRKADKITASTICRLRLDHACTPVHLAKIRIRDPAFANVI